MKDIKAKIIGSEKIKLKYLEENLYQLSKKVYLYFENEIINKDKFEKLLLKFENELSKKLSKFKTLIIIGETTEEYLSSDLLFFNNIDTFVVFCLVNKSNEKIYINNKWIFTLGLNYKKYTTIIKHILEQ